MDQRQLTVRRNVLDDSKRRQILAIVTNGSSRRVAARIVGCSPSTITRTAERDPEFGQQLALAEHTLELEAMQTLRRVARQDKYWRAALWIAERKNPDDFGFRAPTAISLQETTVLFGQLMETMRDALPYQTRQLLVNRFNELVARYDAQDAPVVANEWEDDEPPEMDRLPGS